MNGAPLTADHGAPVRLVVPGWYGCAWIKWVNEIALGRRRRAAPRRRCWSSRSARTRTTSPTLARDYEAPAIDTAAMPIRVEQRRVDGATRVPHRRHRLGRHAAGRSPGHPLRLARSRHAGSRLPGAVDAPHVVALDATAGGPTEPGYYDITLRAADPAVRTRRLDLSFYIRRVRIDEV